MADLGMDIREMTFQNVLDTILTPAGVKVGGFPHELFLDLTEEEKEKWSCGICFLVSNDCRLCDNRHTFCHTCVFAWSMTYGENSQKCPMCRCDQREYLPDKETNQLIDNKRVKCPEENCSFKSPLKIFLMHSHGKAKYSNVHVDFEKLKMARPSGRRILLLPGILGTDRDSRMERRLGIRGQLQQVFICSVCQGRVMIHQMMMLLHMEMQLRQQALISYQEANDPVLRLQRLDEVLALNEQLNEVGGILSALLNTPLTGLPSAVAARVASPERQHPFTPRSGPGNGGSSSPTRIMRARGLMNPVSVGLDDDDSDDSDDGSITDIVTSARRQYVPPRTLTPLVTPSLTPRAGNDTPRPQVDTISTRRSSTRDEPTHEVPQTRRQSETRQEAPTTSLSNSGSTSTVTDSSSTRDRGMLARQAEPPVTRQATSLTTVTTSVQRLGPRSCVTEVVERETTPPQTPREEMSLPAINQTGTSSGENPRGTTATRNRGSSESAAVRAALTNRSTGDSSLFSRPNSVARQRAVSRLSTLNDQPANLGTDSSFDTRSTATESETQEVQRNGDAQSVETNGRSSSLSTTSRAVQRRSLQNSRLPPRVNHSNGSRTSGARPAAGRDVTRGNTSGGSSNIGNSVDNTNPNRAANNTTESTTSVPRRRSSLVAPNSRTGPVALPRTPGQLIRARRRSEIQRHLYRDRSGEN